MSDNDHIDDLIIFGKNAKRILDDTTLQAVMQSVREDVHVSWSQTSPHATQEREQYFHLLKAVDLLEEKLWAVADNAHILKLKAENITKNKKGV